LLCWFAGSINVGRGKAGRRPNYYKTQRAKVADGINSLPPSTTDSRSVVEEKRNVASQLRGKLGQLGHAPVESPALVCGHKRRGRIAGSSTKPRRDWYAFDQPQPGPATDISPTAEQLDSSKYKVLATVGNALYRTGSRW